MMPQRTLGDARRRLEDLTPNLNDYHRREAAQALAAAEEEAKKHVQAMVSSELERLTAKHVDALRELCEVRDAMAELTRLGSIGQLDAATFAGQLQALEARQARAERVAEQVTAALEHVERMEDDPVGYADERLYSLYPHLRPHFDW